MRRGAILVETALVFCLMLVTLLSASHLAWLGYCKVRLQQAARVAARIAALGGRASEVSRTVAGLERELGVGTVEVYLAYSQIEAPEEWMEFTREDAPAPAHSLVQVRLTAHPGFTGAPGSTASGTAVSAIALMLRE